MALSIKWNDAWESIPLEFASEVIERIREDLQTSHPLRDVDFFPAAKLWRRWRYLLEDGGGVRADLELVCGQTDSGGGVHAGNHGGDAEPGGDGDAEGGIVGGGHLAGEHHRDGGMRDECGKRKG